MRWKRQVWTLLNICSWTVQSFPTLRPPLRESEMRNITLSLKHSEYTNIDILYIIKQLPFYAICLSWKASPWREARLMQSNCQGRVRAGEAARSAGCCCCCWPGKYLHFLRLVTAESHHCPHSSLSSPRLALSGPGQEYYFMRIVHPVLRTNVASISIFSLHLHLYHLLFNTPPRLWWSLLQELLLHNTVFNLTLYIS